MRLLLLFFIISIGTVLPQDKIDLNNTKIDGYRGIWYELNQKYDGRDKYSGGLGTYTAKHMPIAIYSPKVNKTFFVYGGTTSRKDKHLLSMIGEYNHLNQLVSKPTVVYDKLNVADPHDNPSLLIDNDGYIWVFVSGRGKIRKGIKLKSKRPYNIDEFEIISEEIFTYPQIWKTRKGFFHFFTKYTPKRELYYETSKDGLTWTSDNNLALIKNDGEKYGGHYQVSGVYKNGKITGTFFNRHINGNPDKRTDLYYIQTRNYGKSWEDVRKIKTKIPLIDIELKERVFDFNSKNKNVYLKDMGYDNLGNPACLYLISNGHESGLKNAPYEWFVTFWRNNKWITSKVCESDHNYDMGSLFISDLEWNVVVPSNKGPQEYGAGGEIVVWKSYDLGQNWEKDITVTRMSKLNNSYIRRPINAMSPFSFFWANGNTQKFSSSELFFGDFNGNVWKLPYNMNKSVEKPIKINY